MPRTPPAAEKDLVQMSVVPRFWLPGEEGGRERGGRRGEKSYYLEKLTDAIQGVRKAITDRKHLLKASFSGALPAESPLSHPLLFPGPAIGVGLWKEGVLSLCLDWLPRGQSWSWGLIWSP